MATPAELVAAALNRWIEDALDHLHEDIVQDLQDHAPRIQAHPLVQALAGAPMPPSQDTPLTEGELEDLDPQQEHHVLDADGSQRLCLLAASRGESFVMLGAPGTGKSQTIANLIADAVAHGKKALFVSNQPSAFEIINQRMRAVGLGEYCLALEGDQAIPAAVVEEPRPALKPPDFARLKECRDELNRYVRALHEPREPMKKSAWEVLAELPRWQHLAMVPLGLHAVRQADDTATKTLAEFTPGDVAELSQMLERLQGRWHIRTDTNYPWRGFKADRYTPQLRDEVVSLIDRVRARGDKLRTAAEHYAGQFGLPGSMSASALLKLGDLLEKRPPAVLPGWLTMPNLAAFTADFEKCAEQYARLGHARTPLTERYGQAIWKLPTGSTAKIEQAWKHAASLLVPVDAQGSEFLKHQSKLRAWAADTQKRIPNWLTEIRTLEKWLALPLALGAGSSSTDTKLDPAVKTVRAFVRLANLGVGEALPDRAWLEDRNRAVEAQTTIAASKPAFMRYKQNRQYLLKLYDAKLFKLELIRIGQAYTGPYLSWRRAFSWQYRKDRRAIAKCRPMEDLPASVAHDMQLAAQLQADREALDADQSRRGPLLGRYDKGIDTDIEIADRAARHAQEAQELLPFFDCERFPPKCIDALTAGLPAEKIRGAVKRLNESFAAWAHLTQELQAVLPSNLMPGIGAPLEDCSLSGLTHYAKDLQSSLNHFASLADPLLSATPPADMKSLIADLAQTEELLAFEASQATEADRWTKQLGPAFQGVGTDWDCLRKAIAWARLVKDCIPPNGMNDALTQAATTTPPSSRELRHALEPFEHALHSLEIRFDAPGPLLDGKALRDHSPEAVLKLLTQWRDRTGELADWVDWRYLPERFGHLGLRSFWEHLQQHDVAHEQVVDLFQKSFWSAWVEAVFHHDPALNSYRRETHGALVNEFRALDRRIIQSAAEGIRASQAAAPSADKPCLMMSPLSVSRKLPTDESTGLFDLVVIDEAAQISPAEAVGAIFRGKQLVVVGDEEQLESAGRESLLDVCRAVRMPTRTLTCHYRSQPDPDAPEPFPLTALHTDVIKELKKLGFDSVPFVDCGPDRLDIGVGDPKQADRFALGIEFDGLLYAEAVTARDRVRLRPEVLARLGWKLHHIAAADWGFRKDEEIARLRQALSDSPR